VVAQHLVKLLLEQDPPQQAVPLKKGTGAAKEFLIRHGYMGDYKIVEQNGSSIIVFPYNGLAINTLIEHDKYPNDWIQDDDAPNKVWVAVFNQDTKYPVKMLIRLEDTREFSIRRTDKASWDDSTHVNAQLVFRTFPKFSQELKLQVVSRFQTLDPEDYTQSLHNMAQAWHTFFNEQQFVTEFAVQLRNNRSVLRRWAEWPKWLQLLCYRAGITRRKPDFIDGIIVDRHIVRVMFDDWTDPEILLFVSKGYRKFAENLMSGDFQNENEGNYPEGALKSFRLGEISRENTTTLQNLIIGRTVEAETEGGERVTLDDRQARALDADMIFDLVDDGSLLPSDDIDSAVRRALSDADSDALENAYLKYYQDGIANAVGAIKHCFVEVEKGKTWKLQFDIALSTLQEKAEQYRSEHQEEEVSVTVLLDEFSEKFEPSDHFEPSYKMNSTLFNQMLEYHLNEL
jgi:hypothetical protein